jgi:hypothetical protein
MATVEQFLAGCRAEIGYTENPPGSNRTKFAAEAGFPNGQAWCATGLVAIARRVGLTLPLYTPNASALVNSFGNIHIHPQPGDFVGYHFSGEAAGIDHVGVVESVDLLRAQVTSIEFNTTPGTAGVQSNGGGVYRRTRPFAQVVGFGRPSYKEAPVADAAQPAPDYKVNAVPVSIAVLADGSGYIILCADGGIICFGTARFLGRVHV